MHGPSLILVTDLRQSRSVHPERCIGFIELLRRRRSAIPLDLNCAHLRAPFTMLAYRGALSMKGWFAVAAGILCACSGIVAIAEFRATASLNGAHPGPRIAPRDLRSVLRATGQGYCRRYLGRRTVNDPECSGVPKRCRKGAPGTARPRPALARRLLCGHVSLAGRRWRP